MHMMTCQILVLGLNTRGVTEMFAILLGYTLHQDFLLCVLVPQFAINEQILLTATHQVFIFYPIGVTPTICQVLDERYSLVRLLSGRWWFGDV